MTVYGVAFVGTSGRAPRRTWLPLAVAHLLGRRCAPAVPMRLGIRVGWRRGRSIRAHLDARRDGGISAGVSALPGLPQPSDAWGVEHGRRPDGMGLGAAGGQLWRPQARAVLPGRCWRRTASTRSCSRGATTRAPPGPGHGGGQRLQQTQLLRADDGLCDRRRAPAPLAPAPPRPGARMSWRGLGAGGDLGRRLPHREHPRGSGPRRRCGRPCTWTAGTTPARDRHADDLPAWVAPRLGGQDRQGLRPDRLRIVASADTVEGRYRLKVTIGSVFLPGRRYSYGRNPSVSRARGAWRRDGGRGGHFMTQASRFAGMRALRGRIRTAPATTTATARRAPNALLLASGGHALLLRQRDTPSWRGIMRLLGGPGRCLVCLPRVGRSSRREHGGPGRWLVRADHERAHRRRALRHFGACVRSP